MYTAPAFTQACAALSFFSGLMLTGMSGRLIGKGLGHGAEPRDFPPEYILTYGAIAGALGFGLFIWHIRRTEARSDEFYAAVVGTFLCGVGIAGFLLMFFGLLQR